MRKMCDTLYIPGDLTADGVSLFAKNSDREANEAQYLFASPRMSHPTGEKVKCTYIEIPQIAETYGILISRPFWLWGGEMGTNEFGLTIGNEAVFSKVPEEKEAGLIGMDLLRLALERAKDAREALDVITNLLEAYGQAGSGGLTHHFSYDNSFLIADPQQAWVLETAGRHWVVEKVAGVRTISNGHTIGSDYDLISTEAISFAEEKGWHKKGEAFHFARSYADFINTRFSQSGARQCRTMELLSAKKGQATIADMMAALRDHGSDDSGANPLRMSPFTFTVCAHAGWGPVRQAGQSTASMVSHLSANLPTHFFTASSAPCTGVFKPFWVDAGLPDMGPAPTDQADESSFWWEHEQLHRRIIQNLPLNLALYREEREQLEHSLVEEALSARTRSAESRLALSQDAFDRMSEAEKEWLVRVIEARNPVRMSPLHASAWKKLNRSAGIEIPA